MEIITPIYSGKPEDFRWVGFGSGSGTNLRELAGVCLPSAVFSNVPGAKLFLHDILNQEGIEHIAISSKGMKGQRERYDQLVLDALHRHEDTIGHGIDLIALGGYMRIVSDVLLKAYPDKIINVHPADLTILYHQAGRPMRKYVGDNAVFDAIRDGCDSTRSSVIMVDSGTDHGEILTMGDYVRVDMSKHFPTQKSLKEYVDSHQDKQKETSDWPAFKKALELIRDGRLALGTEKEHHKEWRTVYLDKKPLPYAGLILR